MRHMTWPVLLARASMAGAGAWALVWTFRAWQDAGLLLAIIKGTYGCG